MQIIPLQAVESQSVLVNLDGQNVQIDVYQKFTGLFLNLWLNNSLILGGIMCQNQNPVVRDSYLGFGGDLFWIDNQGSDDPIYTGVGARFSLAYVDASDDAIIQQASIEQAANVAALATVVAVTSSSSGSITTTSTSSGSSETGFTFDFSTGLAGFLH